jgi:ERCC4-type nuclease
MAFRLIIDSREQLPFNFSRYDVETEVRGLPAGDYSIPGFEDKAAVERKSIEDLVGCLKNKGRERFERELAKARPYELFSVVCEASWRDLAKGNYRSDMKPQAVCQSVLTFHIRYGVPFIWAGTRAAAEYITYSLLQKYAREISERFKLLSKNNGTPI